MSGRDPLPGVEIRPSTPEDTNRPAIALYERFGFEREGVKRAARVLGGRSEDILCMALLLPECAEGGKEK